MPDAPSRQQRQQIEARADGVCEYCKSPVQYAVQSFECEHIIPNENFTLIIGITATGRATVKTMRLNRSGVLNLRRILLMASEHPPEDWR